MVSLHGTIYPKLYLNLLLNLKYRADTAHFARYFLAQQLCFSMIAFLFLQCTLERFSFTNLETRLQSIMRSLLRQEYNQGVTPHSFPAHLKQESGYCTRSCPPGLRAQVGRLPRGASTSSLLINPALKDMRRKQENVSSISLPSVLADTVFQRHA